jgi:ribonuclease Z
MPHLFNPTLVNRPWGDPGLFVSFFFNKRAILFDLGEIHTLSPRDLLKISHVFITHTHMDHFCGFDHLLRILLGREKTLYLYGPEDFLKNLEGKLNSYSWNLVNNYAKSLNLSATEVRSGSRITRQYFCRNEFIPCNEERFEYTNHWFIHQEPSFNVSTTVLDHGIPTLGFAVEEKFKINIKKDILETMGLTPGPWVQALKQALYKGNDPEDAIMISENKKFSIRELASLLTLITKGQKVVYISDVAYSNANLEKMLMLAKNADHLFIESAFLDKDRAHAEKKFHLTARQAGKIAALSGAKRFTLFHFSPRYAEPEETFYQEALAEYMKYCDRIE